MIRRRNQPHKDLEEEYSRHRNSSWVVLAMRIFKQKKASQPDRGSMVEDEVRELVRTPDYTWPRNHHRFDFYSKYNGKPLEIISKGVK